MLNTMELIFQCDDFASLPRILSHQSDVSEITRQTAMTVEEVIIANLGDAHIEPHLLVHLITSLV
jgi:hypothetical protein